jgi:hypothetical protein
MIPSSFIGSQPISAGRLAANSGALAILLLLLAISTVSAQQAQTAPSQPNSSSAVITFTLDFPNSEPTHYAIAVDANGHGTYDCLAKASDDSDPQPYHADFTMSLANRDRIFAWARQAGYFAGKVDSGNKKLAFMGAKTLSYQEGEKSFSAQYNVSNIEPVRQLTDFFQKMASTLDYGRQLSFSHRYQKLALDDELKRMEAQAKSDELTEIQSVASILEEIASDASVINGVRARARELLQMGATAPTH